MRNLILAVLVAGLVAAGCGMFGKKGVSPEEAGKSLAQLLCEKHAGCPHEGEFNKERCVQEISSGLTERLKAQPDAKVAKAALDTCSRAISSGDCAILTSDQPPAGCEFLE